MSGSTIPYQLRVNKAVDRYVFLDLLNKINRFIPIEKASYVGFGSFSLEDFKYIHSQLGISKMVSLEMDPLVYERQKFNIPLNCIESHNMSSSEYIEAFNSDTEETIITWLDYTAPDQLREQIEEFQLLLLKSKKHDILKITLNAHASSYYDQNSYYKDMILYYSEVASFYGKEKKVPPAKELQAKRQDKIQNMLGSLFPQSEVNVEMMTGRKLPQAISQIVKFAVNISLEGDPDIHFQPLTIFSYADGQTMLTITGILLQRDEIDAFFEATDLKKWKIANLDWNEPRLINIPNLTLKEKMLVDSLLPHHDIDEIQKELNFKFAKKTSESRQMIQNYIDFYRYQPFFSRIIF
ncbi:MAG: O-methyltransferase [Limnothrix sp.]